MSFDRTSTTYANGRVRVRVPFHFSKPWFLFTHSMVLNISRHHGFFPAFKRQHSSEKASDVDSSVLVCESVCNAYVSKSALHKLPQRPTIQRNFMRVAYIAESFQSKSKWIALHATFTLLLLMIFSKKKKKCSQRKTEENGNFYSSTSYNRASLNLEIIQIVYNFQVNTHLVNTREWTAIVAGTLQVVHFIRLLELNLIHLLIESRERKKYVQKYLSRHVLGNNAKLNP